jgi:hypothetical protein
MKTGSDAHDTAENETGSAKHAPSKMSPGTQNMKTRPEALNTAENESESVKHENGNDALGTVEKEP